MANVIDTLFFELGITGDFASEANQAVVATENVEKAVKKVERSAKKTEKSIKHLEKSLDKKEKQDKKNEIAAKNMLEVFGKFTKAVKSLSAAIALLGLSKLADDAAKANIELDNLAKNMGTSRETLQAWQGAAEMSGGSADSVTSSLSSLSDAMTRLIVMGDTSSAQFFNALGVQLLEPSGKAKDLTQIMLELADSFQTMDRSTALTLAKGAGIDEGTFNLLIQGREVVEGYLKKQSQLYRSNAEDIETSRKLTAATKYLNQQFDALKTMIGNAITPVLLKMAESTTKFFDFLMKHEGLVKGVFAGIATGIGMLLLPMLAKATYATISFLLPWMPAILVVGGLAAAFGLLYDDYQKWAEGGQSLFNWGVFIDWFDKATFSLGNLVDGLTYLLTGYKSWGDLVQKAKDWLELKGFTDKGELSLKSLATGFKNIGRDIIDYVMPVFDRLLGILLKIIRLDFSGAWEDVKQLSKDGIAWFGEKVDQAVEIGQDYVNDVGKRATGALDIAGGIDPNDEKSITSAQKSGELFNSAQTMQNAANYAVEHAATQSLKKCAEYVNNALRSEGVKVQGHGKDVARNLIASKQGFREIEYSKDYQPKIGDVMSMPSNSKSGHNYGHVAIYTEKGWVSDFVQGEKYGNTAAANKYYWDEIQSGKIKPTIARRGNWEALPASPLEDYQGNKTVKGLNSEQTKALVKQVISSESGGRVDAVNGFGYLGLYQMGAAALADAGLVSMDKYQQAVQKYGKSFANGSNAEVHKAFLEDSNNWNVQGGQSAFLASKKLQDEAMIRLLNKNAQYLGASYTGNAEHKAGLLMAAHLKGWSNAKAFAENGTDSKDGNGTTVSSYYQKGKNAIARAQVPAETQIAQSAQTAQNLVLAQTTPQNVTNNAKTEVVVNGGINVQSSSSTITGTMNDGVSALEQRFNVMHFNYGVG